MKYNYTEMKENEHSYDNFDLRMTNEVPAVYVRSKMPEDNGNPYIEALPEARTEDEVFTTYNKQPLFPNEKEVRNMSVNEKLEMVALLRKVRFVLPFHALLEQEFNNVLRVSYRDRIGKESEDPIKITMNDTEDSTHVRLKRNVNADEGMITKDAYQWLKTHASDKRSGTKKKAVMDDEHIQIRDELLNN